MSGAGNEGDAHFSCGLEIQEVYCQANKKKKEFGFKAYPDTLA